VLRENGKVVRRRSLMLRGLELNAPLRTTSYYHHEHYEKDVRQAVLLFQSR
jgi:hypothetical protein